MLSKSNATPHRSIQCLVGILVSLLVFGLLYLQHTAWKDSYNATRSPNHSNWNDTYIQQQQPSIENKESKQRALRSGWDDKATKIYETEFKAISTQIFNSEQGVQNIIIPGTSSTLTVSGKLNWWNKLDKQYPIKWEPETFDIYFRFIKSNTILIDFGTWIGVTILYGAQIAYKSYGIEADPAAFAQLQINVELNSDKWWYQNIHIHPGGVSSKNDTGVMTMKSYNPGNSCSGMGEKVLCGKGELTEWLVRCYPLDYYLKHWNIWDEVINNDKRLFIKIDVESYECRLIPGFYEWLVELEPEYLPTMYISYHPQIQKCTDEQYYGFVKVIQLYSFVMCGVGESINIKKMNDTQSMFDMVIKCNQNGKESTFTLYTDI